jgi:hypothetical protein
VGRASDTILELVQITVDLAVLSSIKFVSPSPSPHQLHFAKVHYDTTRSILWVTPFSRGSIYGFHFALKGQSPITGSKEVVAFDQMCEYPLESVLSFVLGDKSEEPDLFFATPGGFSQGVIEKGSIAALAKVETQEPSVPAPVTSKKAEKKANGAGTGTGTKNTPVIKAASRQASPVVVPAVLSQVVGESERVEAPKELESKAEVSQVVHGGGVTHDELQKALKKVGRSCDYIQLY